MSRVYDGEHLWCREYAISIYILYTIFYCVGLPLPVLPFLSLRVENGSTPAPIPRSHTPAGYTISCGMDQAQPLYIVVCINSSQKFSFLHSYRGSGFCWWVVSGVTISRYIPAVLNILLCRNDPTTLLLISIYIAVYHSWNTTPGSNLALLF